MKHIFTLFLNQKRRYGGMLAEQMLVFFVLLFCVQAVICKHSAKIKINNNPFFIVSSPFRLELMSKIYFINYRKTFIIFTITQYNKKLFVSLFNG